MCVLCAMLLLICYLTASIEVRDQCDPDAVVGPGFEEAYSAHEEAVSNSGLAEAPRITAQVVL